MKSAIALGILMLTVAPCFAAEAGAEKTISKSFAVEPGGQFSVYADQGEIEVTTWAKNTLSVVVDRDVTGGSEGQAKKLLESHKVTFSQDGNTVRVEAKIPKTGGFSFRKRPQLNVHFRIIVPRTFDVTLDTAGGSIQVADLHGALNARTSGGDLTFKKIDGVVDGHTSGGDIRATGCTDKLQAQTSGGNIFFTDYSGPSANGDTSGGNVEVKSCTGKLQVRTSGGNISLDGFSGPGVYADTSGGTISFAFDAQPIGDCRFRTSGGNITARLPANIAMNFNATTSGGNITTAIPVTTVTSGKPKEGKLEGTMNGGGPPLTLQTSGGNIEVLKK